MKNMNVYTALEKRYAPPAWALFYEVGNATGHAVSRHADAIAMGIWPSRGLAIHGFELKSYRSDWLRELKDPKKAEEIAPFCDHWWVVAAHGRDADIVHLDEVPADWGYLKFDGKLTVIKDAPKRTPVPLTKEFVAAVLRRAAESVSKATKVELTRAEQEKWIEQGRKDAADGAKFDRQEAERLKRSIEAFEKKSGLRIDRWTLGDIGEAVAHLMNSKTPNYERERLVEAARRLEELAAAARQSLNEYQAAMRKFKESTEAPANTTPTNA